MTKETAHVVPNEEGGWSIKQGGASSPSGHFDRKEDANDRSEEISKSSNSRLYIHKRNGKIVEKNNHGNNSHPTQG